MRLVPRPVHCFRTVRAWRWRSAWLRRRQFQQCQFLSGFHTATRAAYPYAHGGEYLLTEANQYEIVYLPLQVRIYVYDKDEYKPVSARDVHAQMSLQIPAENALRRIPFAYQAMPSGVGEQDYVVAAIDLKQLTEKETPITVEFSGLPDRHHPTVSFVPVFAPSKIRPYVAKVLLTQADRDGVSRQRVCPVSGAVLGTTGTIVKLYIADFPLYVAGDDCTGAVKANPERYLPRLPVPTPAR